jgi:hypothetical protein
MLQNQAHTRGKSTLKWLNPTPRGAKIIASRQNTATRPPILQPENLLDNLS